jgi:hypothetical protein
MFYLQCMWILSNIDIRYPASLSAPFQALQWLFSPSSPRSLGIDCILRNYGHLPVAAQEFLLSMLMPLAIMLVLLAYETMVALVNFVRYGQQQLALMEQLHKLTAASIIVLTTFLPQLVNAVFGLFACVPLDVPASAPYEAKAVGLYWVNHMSQQCWLGYHNSLALGAGIPLILLLCVLWPGSVLLFVLRHRGGSLYSSEVRQYSFLFSLYKPSTAWWEVVVSVQTSLLVAINVLAVGLGTYFGCVMLLAAYFLVYLFIWWLSPYADAVTGSVATRGVLCVVFTSFSALLFMPAGTISGQEGAYELYAVAVGVVVLCINCTFVLWVAWKLVSVLAWRALRDKLKLKGSIGRIAGVPKRPTPVAGVPGRADKAVDAV